MHSAKVTSKGQITIPAEVRQRLRLEPGGRVSFIPTSEGDFVMRARGGSISDLRGCLAGLDLPASDGELNDLIRDRARELDRITRAASSDNSSDAA